jgi:hypothetical protein
MKGPHFKNLAARIADDARRKREMSTTVSETVGVAQDTKSDTPDRIPIVSMDNRLD